MPKTPNEEFNEQFPIIPQDERQDGPLSPKFFNVGRQFVDRITPLMDKMRNRPLSNAYDIEVKSSRNAGGTSSGFATLRHRDLTAPAADGRLYTDVGSVSWDPGSGHVYGLDVDLGHRHMTMKLLQEVWDHSRRKNEYGPASSNDLNENSLPIVQKYNPESEGYAEHLNTDDNTCLNRLRDSWRTNAYMCQDCNGTGGSHLFKDVNLGGWTEHGTGHHEAVCDQEHYHDMPRTYHPDFGQAKPAGFSPWEHGYDAWVGGTQAFKTCSTCDGDAVDF